MVSQVAAVGASVGAGVVGSVAATSFVATTSVDGLAVSDELEESSPLHAVSASKLKKAIAAPKRRDDCEACRDVIVDPLVVRSEYKASERSARIVFMLNVGGASKLQDTVTRVSEAEERPPGFVDPSVLPKPSDARIAVRVSRPGLRAIRLGSPWLFDQAVESHKPSGKSGDLAVVFDDNRRFAAIGLWDPESPIRVKVLHVGKPVTIDDDWWLNKMRQALEIRRELLSTGLTTGFRWIHGENDGLPGLIVDQYASTAVIKLYTGAWFVHLRSIMKALIEIGSLDRVVIRFSRLVRDGETYGLVDGDTLYGEPPTGPIMFLENGLALEADVVFGHKTGHFLDQRDNRAIVRNLASGCRVLDVFSSTGGFTLSAAAGGAKSVHMVDVSAPALATAHRNLEHNKEIGSIASCKVTDVRGDAFAVLEDMVERGEKFDIVILDPPSFAQNQASILRALSSYERLARLGLRLTAPGGTLLQASCSSRVNIDELADAAYLAARTAQVEIDEFKRTEHAVDHPIGFEFGAYLKAIYYNVTPYRD